MTEEQIIIAVVRAIKEAQPHLSPWYQQYNNIVNAAFVLAIGYIAWSARRFFEQFTSSIKDLYEKHNSSAKEISHLQGACEATHQRRRVTDSNS